MIYVIETKEMFSPKSQVSPPSFQSFKLSYVTKGSVLGLAAPIPNHKKSQVIFQFDKPFI